MAILHFGNDHAFWTYQEQHMKEPTLVFYSKCKSTISFLHCDSPSDCSFYPLQTLSNPPVLSGTNGFIAIHLLRDISIRGTFATRLFSNTERLHQRDFYSQQMRRSNLSYERCEHKLRISFYFFILVCSWLFLEERDVLDENTVNALAARVIELNYNEMINVFGVSLKNFFDFICGIFRTFNILFFFFFLENYSV